MYQEQLIPSNIPIRIIQDEKFNEVNISLRILIPMRKETTTLSNVLAEIYSDRYSFAPSKREVTNLKDNLYGLRISSRTYGVGQLQVLDLSLMGINDRFVDEGLHKQYIELLFKLFEEPLINNDTLKEAVKNTRQNLYRIDEEPATYAIYEGFKQAGKNQNFGLNVFGYLEDLDTMTVDDVIAFHQECLSSFNKEIYICGDVVLDDFKPLGTHTQTPITAIQKTLIEPKMVVEEFEGQQSELVQVYQVDIAPGDALYVPYLLFIAILGQSASSYLFQNVREKHSLCYSIYASQLIYDGLFYIATSYNPKNEEQVITLIAEQIENIKQDELSLNAGKRYLINKMNGLTEYPRQMMDFSFRNVRLNQAETPEAIIEQIETASVDEVKEVIDYISKPFTFIYRGVNNEEN